MYLPAFLLAQTTPAGGGGDTAVIVASIGTVGVVLAALITVLGQRNTARHAAIEQNHEALTASGGGAAVGCESARALNENECGWLGSGGRW